MNVSPIHIRVTSAERKLFEGAAAKTGMSISDLVKKAVMAYVRMPMPEDEMTLALKNLGTFVPTAAQLAKHKKVAAEFEKGNLRGLDLDESLALLAELRKKSKK